MKEQDKEILEARRVAYRVRSWALRTFKDRKYFDTSLAGYCAICSHRIFTLLTKLGVPAKFVENDARSHCFVMVRDIYVDCTATQFGAYPQVIVGDIKDFIKGKAHHYWGIGKVAITEQEVKNILNSTPHWPKEQQPSFA